MNTILILLLISYLVTWIWGIISFKKNKGKVVEFKDVRIHLFLSFVT
ncbi:MAG: hypothetical protein SVR08_05545 [Spirochaetota bacterium]|nr:hypothetical protein [Spirochaetota bacterium]